MKKSLKVIITWVLILAVIISEFNIKQAYAKAPSCDMKDGIVTITITTHAATTNTRFKTVGFTVSTRYQNDTVTAKNIKGPAAPPSPNGTFYLSDLSDAEKKDGPIIGGNITTTFTFSDKKVKKALIHVLDLNKITENTKIYFNAIFQVYQVIDGREVLKPGEITTWQDIVNAESWADISDFKDYFNIETEFKPGPQRNCLFFDIDGKPKYQRDLKTLDVGEEVTWKDYVTSPAEIGDKKYDLVSFYAENRETYDRTEEKKVGQYVDGKQLTVNSIINGSFTVQYGGLDIHMVYKEKPDNGGNDESGDKVQYPNSLYYVYNGKSKKVTDLDKKYTGDKVTWYTQMSLKKPESIFGEGNIYTLQGYYIKAKDSSVKLKGTTSLYKSVDGASDQDIKTGNAIVVKGGINVYIVYDKDAPIVTPTPAPSVTPEPSIPPLVIPEGGSEKQTIPKPLSTGIIMADKRGGERFVVQTGIPTTESLYTQVQTTPYMVGYDFEKEVIVKEYTVKGKKTYNLSWKNAKTKKTVTESVPVIQTITIKRACAYWKINSLDYYVVDHAVVYNDALPDGKSIMYPDANYYKPPELSTNKSTSESSHLIDPVANGDVIDLGSESISVDSSRKPSVNPGSFLYAVNEKIGEIRVKNDYVSFDGTVVMNNNYYEKETPALNNLSVMKNVDTKTGINVLYKPDQIIKATLANDTYNSSGMLTYKQHANAIYYGSPTYENMIVNINYVKVHTPVICDPNIAANNKKWVQLIDPIDDYVPLVIDPDSSLSDFTVSISNYGKHSDRVGYYTRDMAWSLRSPNVVSYMAQRNDLYRNEVQFPFDVFLKKSGEDEYIKKNTWITIGFNKPIFYLPMWVAEGTYTVNFRTIAVNAITDEKISKTEKYANTNQGNYVATNSIKVQVSGRVYGLTITDVSDDRTWNDVFHYKGMSALKIDGNYASGVSASKFNELLSYDYTVGTNNQYGNSTGRLPRFTLPLVNGSHPKYSNVGVMKKGYSVKFRLTTTGDLYGSGDGILIRPRFYYVDAKGKNRKEVDIYYTQYFNGDSHDLVKIGGVEDKGNINRYRVDDILPTEAWKRMADLYSINYINYRVKKLDLFTYSRIGIFDPITNYCNDSYLQTIKSRSDYSKIVANGIKPIDILKKMQTWYGEYWLPADIHAVEKGFNVVKYSQEKGINYHEKFWLTNGYIIINFDIITVDGSGKEILSYTNTANALNGYCSMWNMEGAAAYKKSFNGKAKGTIEFSFEPGDFEIYYTNISLRDDYDTFLIK